MRLWRPIIINFHASFAANGSGCGSHLPPVAASQNALHFVNMQKYQKRPKKENESQLTNWPTDWQQPLSQKTNEACFTVCCPINDPDPDPDSDSDAEPGPQQVRPLNPSAGFKRYVLGNF